MNRLNGTDDRKKQKEIAYMTLTAEKTAILVVKVCCNVQRL